MANPVESERFNTDYLLYRRAAVDERVSIEQRAAELAKQIINVRVTEAVARERSRHRAQLEKRFVEGCKIGRQEARVELESANAQHRTEIAKAYFNAGRYAQGARDTSAKKGNEKMLAWENAND